MSLIAVEIIHDLFKFCVFSVTMALKPVLKLKVDELFLRWLSEPETQLSLKENLRQLTHGEALTTPLSHSSLVSPRSSSGKQSPRLRPTSPPFSPPTAKLPSPRSPRRPLSNKNNHRNGTNKVSKFFTYNVSVGFYQRLWSPCNRVVKVQCFS